MSLNMLVLTDIHYVGVADHVCSIEKRKTKQALELIQRVFQSLDKDQIDLVLLLGDLVDNGLAPGAEADMMTLKTELDKLGKPLIAVPGNHDVSPEKVFSIFEDFPGLHNIKGYQIISFADKYADDDSCERDTLDMDKAFEKIDPNLPIIALQHNPVYPEIESSYPYNLKNMEYVMEYYSEKNVILSISGHLHKGIEPMTNEGVGYFVCPALCEEPFYYTIISLKENDYEISVKHLK
jgi:predicted MPP superfamily phosphohydrolase